MNIVSSASKSAKAIFGGATAGLTALFTALSDNGVTAQEWTGISLAVVGTLAVVYGVPNKPSAP